jgi:putative SOS response-associated peptidase YedK
MCGRLNLTSSGSELAEAFGLDETPELVPRYNIAPTQPIAAVRIHPELRRRRLDILRWGLVPSWAKNPSVGTRMINARVESLNSKPAFREAFRERRCLIPTNGFYEWEKRGARQPFVIRRRDGRPFAFAGLWDRWADDASLETCTILTTDANELVLPIHNRMPVILPPAAYELWLDPQVKAVGALKQFLGAAASKELEALPLSERINSPANDDPEVLRPVARTLAGTPPRSRQGSLW